MPLAALADVPPMAAPAHRDLSRLANPEQAHTVHPPDRGKRFMRPKARHGLIECTHDETRDYPDGELVCLTFSYLRVGGARTVRLEPAVLAWEPGQ
jgi:hypothetical protein